MKWESSLRSGESHRWSALSKIVRTQEGRAGWEAAKALARLNDFADSGCGHVISRLWTIEHMMKMYEAKKKSSVVKAGELEGGADGAGVAGADDGALGSTGRDAGTRRGVAARRRARRQQRSLYAEMDDLEELPTKQEFLFLGLGGDKNELMHANEHFKMLMGARGAGPARGNFLLGGTDMDSNWSPQAREYMHILATLHPRSSSSENSAAATKQLHGSAEPPPVPQWHIVVELAQYAQTAQRLIAHQQWRARAGIVSQHPSQHVLRRSLSSSSSGNGSHTSASVAASRRDASPEPWPVPPSLEVVECIVKPQDVLGDATETEYAPCFARRQDRAESAASSTSSSSTSNTADAYDETNDKEDDNAACDGRPLTIDNLRDEQSSRDASAVGNGRSDWARSERAGPGRPHPTDSAPSADVLVWARHNRAKGVSLQHLRDTRGDTWESDGSRSPLSSSLHEDDSSAAFASVFGTVKRRAEKLMNGRHAMAVAVSDRGGEPDTADDVDEGQPQLSCLERVILTRKRWSDVAHRFVSAETLALRRVRKHEALEARKRGGRRTHNVSADEEELSHRPDTLTDTSSEDYVDMDVAPVAVLRAWLKQPVCTLFQSLESAITQQQIEADSGGEGGMATSTSRYLTIPLFTAQDLSTALALLENDQVVDVGCIHRIEPQPSLDMPGLQIPAWLRLRADRKRDKIATSAAAGSSPNRRRDTPSSFTRKWHLLDLDESDRGYHDTVRRCFCPGMVSEDFTVATPLPEAMMPQALLEAADALLRTLCAAMTVEDDADDVALLQNAAAAAAGGASVGGSRGGSRSTSRATSRATGRSESRSSSHAEASVTDERDPRVVEGHETSDPTVRIQSLEADFELFVDERDTTVRLIQVANIEYSGLAEHSARGRRGSTAPEVPGSNDAGRHGGGNSTQIAQPPVGAAQHQAVRRRKVSFAGPAAMRVAAELQSIETPHVVSLLPHVEEGSDADDDDDDEANNDYSDHDKSDNSERNNSRGSSSSSSSSSSRRRTSGRQLRRPEDTIQANRGLSEGLRGKADEESKLDVCRSVSEKSGAPEETPASGPAYIAPIDWPEEGAHAGDGKPRVVRQANGVYAWEGSVFGARASTTGPMGYLKQVTARHAEQSPLETAASPLAYLRSTSTRPVTMTSSMAEKALLDMHRAAAREIQSTLKQRAFADLSTGGGRALGAHALGDSVPTAGAESSGEVGSPVHPSVIAKSPSVPSHSPAHTASEGSPTNVNDLPHDGARETDLQENCEPHLQQGEQNHIRWAGSVGNTSSAYALAQPLYNPEPTSAERAMAAQEFDPNSRLQYIHAESRIKQGVHKHDAQQESRSMHPNAVVRPHLHQQARRATAQDDTRPSAYTQDSALLQYAGPSAKEKQRVHELLQAAPARPEAESPTPQSGLPPARSPIQSALQRSHLCLDNTFDMQPGSSGAERQDDAEECGPENRVPQFGMLQGLLQEQPPPKRATVDLLATPGIGQQQQQQQKPEHPILTRARAQAEAILRNESSAFNAGGGTDDAARTMRDGHVAVGKPLHRAPPPNQPRTMRKRPTRTARAHGSSGAMNERASALADTSQVPQAHKLPLHRAQSDCGAGVTQNQVAKDWVSSVVHKRATINIPGKQHLQQVEVLDSTRASSGSLREFLATDRLSRRYGVFKTRASAAYHDTRNDLLTAGGAAATKSATQRSTRSAISSHAVLDDNAGETQVVKAVEEDTEGPAVHNDGRVSMVGTPLHVSATGAVPSGKSRTASEKGHPPPSIRIPDVVAPAPMHSMGDVSAEGTRPAMLVGNVHPPSGQRPRPHARGARGNTVIGPPASGRRRIASNKIAIVAVDTDAAATTAGTGAPPTTPRTPQPPMCASRRGSGDVVRGAQRGRRHTRAPAFSGPPAEANYALQKQKELQKQWHRVGASFSSLPAEHR